MNKDSLLYKILRVVLFAVLAVIAFMLLFGIIKLVPRAISTLSGITGTSTPATTLTVTADKASVHGGEPFKITATHTNTVSGKYILNYDCNKNVYFEVVSASSSERVVCSDSGVIPTFALRQSVNQTIFEGIVRPFFEDAAIQTEQTITLKVSLLSSSTAKIIGMGSTQITVVPAMTSTTTPPMGTSTYPGQIPPTSGNTGGNSNGNGGMTGTVHHSGTYNKPVGSSDLFTKVVDYGTLVNGGTYISSTQANYPGIVNGVTAMRFVVSNNGPQATGPWTVSGNLPSSDYNSSHFTSAVQPSLQPNDSVLFTLGFGGYTPGAYGLITADPNNSTQDINRGNNSISVGNFATIGGGYKNYYGNNNGGYVNTYPTSPPYGNYYPNTNTNTNPYYNYGVQGPVYNPNYQQTNTFPYNNNPTVYSNYTTGAPADLAISAVVNNVSRVSQTGGTVRVRITNIGGQSADRWSFVVYSNGSRYLINNTNVYNVNNGVTSGYDNGVYRSSIHDDPFAAGDTKVFDIELDRIVSGSSAGYNGDGTYNPSFPVNGSVSAQVFSQNADANTANNSVTVNY